MDPVDPVALARQLIDIDSTTGREGEVAAFLAQYLRGRGYSVLEQPLGAAKAAPSDSGAATAAPSDSGAAKATSSNSGAAKAAPSDSGAATAAPSGSGAATAVPSERVAAEYGGHDFSRARSNATRAPDARRNIIAAVGEPRVVFSTHFDCVPPFFPSRLEGETLHGRGACDAKGILAAQVAAAERLRAEGETRIGLVFVAGEERGSDGAMAANTIASQSKFLINGEPTDNRLAAATRGVFRVRLRTSGRAAHSGYPELGESAIERMVDVLRDMRDVQWPADDLLGTTHYTVGLIQGGVAPNVVPPHAEAEIIFRSVGEHDRIRGALTRVVAGRAEIDEVLEVPVAHFHVEPGFGTAVFSYTTDIPFLGTWGTPLLMGPGSIHVAHTDREQVTVPELLRGVDLYVELARRLLGAG